MLFRLVACVACLAMFACSSSEIEDAIDLIEGIPRKTIDTSKLGVNSFFNDPRFGSIPSQYNEIKGTLRLKFVRVLFAWSNEVQPGPENRPDFSFYDDIASAIPSGVDVLVVLTGLPAWMNDSSNWIDDNPRKTFVERWVKRVVTRYASNPGIIAWQIWNEPNMESNSDNRLLGFVNSPENYVEMLALAGNAAKEIAPGKLVLNAATTAINQNYPDSLNYNRRMRDAGAQSFIDKWAAHYYGRQFENVLRDGGVKDFLNGLSLPIWITESGSQGVNTQLPYGEQVWPFLIDEIRGVERIYQYQFAEATAPEATFGLKNLNQQFPVSDLYIHLRDRE